MGSGIGKGLRSVCFVGNGGVGFLGLKQHEMLPFFWWSFFLDSVTAILAFA